VSRLAAVERSSDEDALDALFSIGFAVQMEPMRSPFAAYVEVVEDPAAVPEDKLDFLEALDQVAPEGQIPSHTLSKACVAVSALVGDADPRVAKKAFSVASRVAHLDEVAVVRPTEGRLVKAIGTGLAWATGLVERLIDQLSEPLMVPARLARAKPELTPESLELVAAIVQDGERKPESRTPDAGEEGLSDDAGRAAGREVLAPHFRGTRFEAHFFLAFKDGREPTSQEMAKAFLVIHPPVTGDVGTPLSGVRVPGTLTRRPKADRGKPQSYPWALDFVHDFGTQPPRRVKEKATETCIVVGREFFCLHIEVENQGQPS